MNEPKYEIFSADILHDEIVVNHSAPLTPPPPPPVLSEEEQALADAVKRFRIEHRRSPLTWRDIFEILHSLGYRKVEQSLKPPESNGSPQDRQDDPGNEKPS
jgi:hypothetical protein